MPIADHQVERGYAVASVEYGLSPDYYFPTPVEDVKHAIRWLKQNASVYGLDGTKIYVVGYSAGAELAALVAAACRGDDVLRGGPGHDKLRVKPFHGDDDALLEAAPAGTLRSFDVNYRPALHGDHNAGRLLDLARRSDVVFCGLDEGRALWGADTPEELVGLLGGPELVVVKQGARGATAFRGGRSWLAPAPEVEVVEPVGAGDAFAAGFLDRLLDRAPIPDCLAEGARLAGRTLVVRGDVPPPGGAAPASCETGTVPARGNQP